MAAHRPGLLDTRPISYSLQCDTQGRWTCRGAGRMGIGKNPREALFNWGKQNMARERNINAWSVSDKAFERRIQAVRHLK